MTVLISGKEVEKLLDIPKVPFGICLEMWHSITELLTGWHVVIDFLTGLCFDTTSLNTGIPSSAFQCYHTCSEHIYQAYAFF